MPDAKDKACRRKEFCWEMLVSVIIPTYNRKDMLRESLASLCYQTCPAAEYEVVIADDGSTDGTGTMIEQWRAACTIIYDWKENSGVNAARNRGALLARGPILLFLDDDMIADPGLLEAHVATHRRFSDVLVKGRVEWTPLGEPTTFAAIMLAGSDLEMELNEEAYIPFDRVFAGHFSIEKANFLKVGLWDEAWNLYGFRDRDFMYRAHKAGFRMVYNPHALTFHRDHVTRLEQHCRRSRQAAWTAATLLFTKHPELEGTIPMFRDMGYINWRDDPHPLVLRKLVRSIMIQSQVRRTLETLIRVVECRWPSPALLRPLYRWIISTYICLGYRQGLRARHG